MLALARKYRPKRFTDVAVQSHVSATLKGAIARGRVAHGYLLCGPRGVGKTTLARVLAMALNCERRSSMGDSGEPCGECTSCQRIWTGASSLDVVEIDAASNRGVDDARELRERAMYAPSGDDRYKVYIVDEAHMLTREAWNALLKILEEPPPRVVFVFATTEPQRIAQSAAPVLSRLQRFDFKRIGAADVKERLAAVLASENVSVETDALSMIARAADGSMRDALSLTDQVLALGDGRLSVERVRESLGLVAEDEFIAVLDLVEERRAGAVFPFVARLADAGVDFGGFLTGLADMMRALLALVLGGDATDVSDRARGMLEERRPRWSAGDLLRMLAALGELEPRFRKSGQQQLLIETLLVRFALMDRTVEIESLLRGMSGGGGSSSGTSGSGGSSGGAHSSGTAARPPRPAASATLAVDASPRPRRTASPVPPAPHAAPEPNDEPPFEPSETGAPPNIERSASRSTTSSSSPTSPRPSASSSSSPSSTATPRPAIDVNRLTERWDDLVARVRADSKRVLASALAHAMPAAVTAAGDVTVALDEHNEIFARALESGRGDIAAILGEWFDGVGRVQLRAQSAPAPAPRRLTDEMIRSERLTALRKRDPVLGAAIDTLDLDVVD